MLMLTHSFLSGFFLGKKEHRLMLLSAPVMRWLDCCGLALVVARDVRFYQHHKPASGLVIVQLHGASDDD